MIDECLHCGNDLWLKDDSNQYCNDYCEEQSDMELLDKLNEEITETKTNKGNDND